MDQRGALFEPADAVVDEIHLPTSVELAPQRLMNHLLVGAGHHRSHRTSVGWGGGHQRHVPEPRDGHLQGAGDGGGGEGEHVDVGLERLDALFCRDAEALLLVHDQEAQSLEVHVLGEQSMGPDDDVDRPFAQPAGDGVGPALGLEAAEHGDLERIGAQACIEGHLVLLRQHRGRAHERHLTARHRDPEGGAEGDLGLAEAHVAAHQPIHGALGFEIDIHVGDGACLILGLLEGEGGLEGAVFVVHSWGGHADGAVALGVEGEELVGDVAHLFARLGLGTGEGLPPQPVQARSGVPPVELVDLVQPVDREVELVAPRVGNHQKIHHVVTDPSMDEALVATDAVLDVDDVVAHGERAQIFQHLPGSLLPERLACCGRCALAEDLLGDQRSSGEHPCSSSPTTVSGGAARTRQELAVEASSWLSTTSSRCDNMVASRSARCRCALNTT